VARTDACDQDPCLTLDAPTINSMRGNEALGGAGSAMLITNLSNAYMACGPNNENSLGAPASAQANAPCRRLLRVANPEATGSPGLATVGEAIRFCEAPGGNVAAGCQPLPGAAAVVANVTVAPGQPFNASATVIDGFGEALVGGVGDANLLMGVQLVAEGGAGSGGGGARARAGRRLSQQGGGGCSLAPTLLGNTTKGINGTSYFSAVTMFAQPGASWGGG
jgi:hypothetical protein